MKKILGLTLILILIFTVGCGVDEGEEVTPEETTIEEITPEETTPEETTPEEITP
ncbi:hypothetical protein K8M07_08690 [Schnuerera sp. xch1]|uniref:hypothetical protein n=1 Tax=Schnuerera sp. xch1 TaxID=2874283 RepID=UPI001CBE0329|nr:hypothetical protein [Schnuerera sp. xch1]MBZ2175324.1 hypothetical protein [Schnuerera sp. xch1]